MYKKVSNVLMDEAKEAICFNQGKFPFVYLDCPITHARMRKAYYNELIKKVKGRLQNWKGILLSYEGKAVLINSVLWSIPLYLLSVVVRPKLIIYELHKFFNRFLWSNKDEGKVNIRFHGIKCAILEKKDVWVVDPYFILLKLFLLNNGGVSEHQDPCGLIICGISTVRRLILQ